MFICVRLVFSSVLHIRYVEVRISRSISEGPFDFEITRVDCIYANGDNFWVLLFAILLVNKQFPPRRTNVKYMYKISYIPYLLPGTN